MENTKTPTSFNHSIDPLKIIHKYYNINSKPYKILIKHSKAVTKKSLEIAKKIPHLNPNLKFIEEAAMLHDIGVFLTKAPEIGCNGKYPYIFHGVLGKKILDKEGFPKHGLVCERHIGIGLSAQDIKEQNLPLEKKDIKPISIEEKIISFVYKFFSKNKNGLAIEKTLEQVKKELSKYGKSHIERLNKLAKELNYSEN